MYLKSKDSGDLGRKGEDLACQYLEKIGHTILERNVHSGHLEIDIISMDSHGIHFVEVKTRRAPVQLTPEDCVTPIKQKRITKAAKDWLRKKENKFLAGKEYSFDIMGILFDRDNYEINYIEQAFIPLYV